VVEHLQRRTARACLWVARPEDHAPQARMHDRARAHRAGLNCNIQAATGKAVVPELPGGAAQDQDFRVRGRIAQVDRAIVGAGDDASVLDDHRAYGSFVLIEGSPGLTEGQAHEPGIFFRLDIGRAGSRHEFHRTMLAHRLARVAPPFRAALL